MKKIDELAIIKAVEFDLQQSVKDLFIIVENLYKDLNEIKSTLKNKISK